ncbi:prolyl oligopeptidase family serine peptidase [Mucilaginibacter sp. HMF5004]|uniref:carboxylesterase family protein n=1 Tax=Mucilaginibacter rivuli TaxID=2857527 RepID=UPI001C5E0CE9|nr:prolyl oligopeptidase family serine peptidase [Mucilaginibacter rivuli]MBW4891249.1 prolyl oligopeptidase family serine peptidase [Mucilaginibacter rivuli]
MNRSIQSLLIKLKLASPSINKAQDFDRYKRDSYSLKKETISYRILFPSNFDSEKTYPLVLVLHGSGERGNDNSVQLNNGGALFLQNKFLQNDPAIVIFPQCSKDGFWANVHIDTTPDGNVQHNFQIAGEPTRDMALLLGAIDDFLSKPYVDKDRVYVGGLSMGGMGTLELLRRRPNVFAAAFSICGGDNALNAKSYAQTPLWLFHGEDDTIVPAAHSKDISTAIEKFGGKPKLTLYQNVAHNSWSNAFAEPELLPWLFLHSKKEAQ